MQVPIRSETAQPQPEQPAPVTGIRKFSSGFRALHERNYRLYWIGQLVSMTGTWMQTTAQALLVLQLTNSPFAIGLVATFQFLPVMIFSLFGGVIADRVPRYRMILITQTLAMILASIFGLLVGTGLIQLWQIYVLALLQGLVNAMDQPVRQAFAVELVNPANRTNSIALNSVSFNVSRIIGPALAGILIAPLGIAMMLYLNAASFLAVLLSLLVMNTKEIKARPPQQRAPVLAQLREGLSYTWRTPDVLMVMILMAFIGTFGYNFSVTLPLIGGFILHTDAAQYGVLGAALGVGSLCAAIANAFMQRVTVRRLLGGATAFSLLLSVVAMTSHYGLALALLLALGFAGISFTTAANTMIQLRVPDELRGRVTSLYFLLFAGSTPLGGLVIGSAANAFGVAEALALCAVLCLVGVVVGWLYGRHAGVSKEHSTAG